MMRTAILTKTANISPNAISEPSHALLRRKCALGNSAALIGEDDGFDKKCLTVEQRYPNWAEPVSVPPIVNDVLQSPGQPLDAATRSVMGSCFGHDFGQVRVHADSRAAQSARAVHALAYTVGQDIVFGAGKYVPERSDGKKLLAHELTHVVQQGRGTAHASSAAHAHEREADQIADAVASSASAVSPHVATETILARQSEGRGEQEYPLPVKMSAPAEREREIEALEVGGKSYVLFQADVRSEGSSSWRANNPGNMDYSPDTREWGAYEGKKLRWGDHRFAIFPNETTGLKAVGSFLRKHQTIRDIRLMMKMFAPAGDVTNNPSEYARSVAAGLGVPVTTLVKDLSNEQIEAFAREIKRVEGWKPGKVYRRRDAGLPEAVRERA